MLSALTTLSALLATPPSPPLTLDQVRELRVLLKAKPQELLIVSSPAYKPGQTPTSLPPKQAALLVRFVEEQRRVRSNLLTASSNAIKLLIKASLHQEGIPLGEEIPEVQAVVVVLDMCLRHGLKPKKNLWGVRRLYFDMVQDTVSKLGPQSASTIKSITEMTDLRSGEQGVAWIQMSLMDKQLADNMKAIVEDIDLIKQWYEPYAFMLTEQAGVLLGLLLGSSTINFNFFIKASHDSLAPPAAIDDEDYPLFKNFAMAQLDEALSVRESLLELLLGAHFAKIEDNGPSPSHQLQIAPQDAAAASPPPETPATALATDSLPDTTFSAQPAAVSTATSAKPQQENDEIARRLTSVLNQNAYLEQMQRDLQGKLAAKAAAAAEALAASSDLRKKLDEATEHASLSEEKRQRLDAEHARLKATSQQQYTALREDMESERQSSQNAKTELNNLYQKEIGLRKQCEAALDQERVLRAETESRESYLLQKQKEAIVDLDNERCEHNRERASLSEQLKQALARLEDVQAAKDKTSEDLNKARIARKLISEEKKQLDQSVARLDGQLQMVNEKSATLEARRMELEAALATKVQVEKELEGRLERQEAQINLLITERDTAQKSLQAALTRIDQLLFKLEQAKPLEQRLAELDKQILELRAQVDERDSTIVELAGELGKSKVKVDNLVTYKKSIKRSQWLDDREIFNCDQCQTAFNLIVRKHHCRNCGKVFCDACTTQRMLLPSSAAPERVCDRCHDLLLSQHTVD